MIFLEGLGPMLVVGNQLFTTQEISKNRKNAKKSGEYFPCNPGFSAGLLKEGFMMTGEAVCVSMNASLVQNSEAKLGHVQAFFTTSLSVVLGPSW